GSSSVIPLDMVAKKVNYDFDIDISEISSLNQERPILKNPVIKDTIVNIFSSTVQTTIINPVSGQPIRISSIKGKSFYKGSLLGDINETFSSKNRDGSINCSKCILLVPNTETITPKLKANLIDKSNLWNLFKDSMDGSLVVDAEAVVEILIGNDLILEINVKRNNIPINLKL
ncbi:hypothetical protein AYI70_g10181, partial [Smittium culicis]